MSNTKISKLQIFLNGLIKENPVLVLVLGTCPTLAISTSVVAAFGMGIAATVVLICSNTVSYTHLADPSRPAVQSRWRPA